MQLSWQWITAKVNAHSCTYSPPIFSLPVVTWRAVNNADGQNSLKIGFVQFPRVLMRKWNYLQSPELELGTTVLFSRAATNSIGFNHEFIGIFLLLCWRIFFVVFRGFSFVGGVSRFLSFVLSLWVWGYVCLSVFVCLSVCSRMHVFLFL